MCKHIYIHIHIHMHTHSLLTHTHIYTHTCVFVCVFLLRKTDLTSQNHDFTGGTYVYSYTYILTHIYSLIYVCMYINVCIYINIGKSILFVGDVNMRTLAELFLREVCKYQAVIHLDASSTKNVQFVGEKR